MMDRGISLPCSQLEAAFLKAVLTEEQITSTLTAARTALPEIAGSPIREIRPTEDEPGIGSQWRD